MLHPVCVTVLIFVVCVAWMKRSVIRESEAQIMFHTIQATPRGFSQSKIKNKIFIHEISTHETSAPLREKNGFN